MTTLISQLWPFKAKIDLQNKIEQSKSILQTHSISLLQGSLEIPLKAVLQRIYDNEDQKSIIVLSGTLVEGIGNLYSDLDVLVLTENMPDEKLLNIGRHSDGNSIHNACKTSKDKSRWSTHDYFEEQGVQIEIQYSHISHFHTALSQLGNAFENILQLRDNINKPIVAAAPSNLDHNYKEMFHRLSIGIPIQNLEKYAEFIQQIPIHTLCMTYYRWTRLTYTLFKDVLGAIDSGNLESAVFMTLNALVEQMKGLSHLIFNTNDKLKWIFSYIQQFPLELREIKLRFQELFDSPKTTSEEKKYFIEQAFDLIDSIFYISNDLIDLNFPSVQRKKAFDGLYNQSITKNSNHPQLLRQFAFLERYCSKKFLPSKEFINNQAPIKPFFCFE